MIDTAVILAAGSKAHQSQIIYNRPRTMLPALGKPLVVRAMDRLYRIGISKYIVVLGEKDGNVAAYLNSKWLPNVEIEFTLKRDTQPLGKILAPIIKKFNQPLLITNYNSFTHPNFPARLLNYHKLSPEDLIVSGAKSSLSASDTQTFAQVSLPETNEIGYNTTPREAAEDVQAISKLTTENYQNLFLADIVACGTAVVDYVSEYEDSIRQCNSLADIASTYLATGNMVRVARSSWVLQVQTDDDLLTLNRHLLDEKIDAHILSEIPYTVRIIEPVRIDPGVSIGQGAVIGPHVYLEMGSSVGRNTSVRNSIVLERSSVAANEKVEDAIISTRGAIALTRSQRPS